jgi:hypothetical protein
VPHISLTSKEAMVSMSSNTKSMKPAGTYVHPCDAAALLIILTRLLPEQQRFVYLSQRLEDGRTLSEYGIKAGVTVHLGRASHIRPALKC